MTGVHRRGPHRRAASDRHSQAVLHTNKGIESLKQGDLPGAVQALTLAVAAEPDFADANHYLGIALSATGKLAEGSRAFRAAISARPSDPEIHFNYGVSLTRQHDWTGAEREFRRVLELRPDHPDASCLLAETLRRVGRQSAAAHTIPGRPARVPGVRDRPSVGPHRPRAQAAWRPWSRLGDGDRPGARLFGLRQERRQTRPQRFGGFGRGREPQQVTALSNALQDAIEKPGIADRVSDACFAVAVWRAGAPAWLTLVAGGLSIGL